MESRSNRPHPGLQPRYRFELCHPKGDTVPENKRAVVLSGPGGLDDVRSYRVLPASSQAVR